MNTEKLYKHAAQLVTPGKGILAADQSARTMNKQLAAIGVEKVGGNAPAVPTAFTTEELSSTSQVSSSTMQLSVIRAMTAHRLLTCLFLRCHSYY
ncbi:MAG: class I fructose-bisphosphate aldolase [Candidatus Paceibacterota bacterium]